MDYTLWLIIGGSSAIAFYMAWSIGSNDVANSMATAVGAKAITFKQAVIIAGILNFVGAVFVGPHVTETVRKGIVDVGGIDSTSLLLGFIASLLAAAIWVTLSTWKEMPISTTHSVIGALMGFGIIAGGLSAVNWGKVGSVVASWVLSPIAGCILAFIVFKIIVRTIFAKERPVKSAKVVGPVIIGITALLISSSLLMKTPLGKSLEVSVSEALLISGIISIFVTIIGIILLRKIEDTKTEDYFTVEGIFRKLQIITSCYVAFSHGANDVANAIVSYSSPVEELTMLVCLGSLALLKAKTPEG